MKTQRNIKFLLAVGLVSVALFNVANATSASVAVSTTVMQDLAFTVTPPTFGRIGPAASGTVTAALSNSTCTVGGVGVTYYSGATCGTLDITSGATGTQINVSLDTPNFTVGDGAAHTMTGSLNVSSSTCYISSGGAPLCSAVKIGGDLSVGDATANPAGAYTTGTGGSPASLTLTYS
ncbi:MAG: hypothetical protein K0Q57_353 [Gammaproteobacteria bacterium]|nr:hypothetical protein [Gammaproteobacteria bacterium]